MEKQMTNDSLSPKVLPALYNIWKSKTKGFNTAQLIVVVVMLLFFVVALITFIAEFISSL